MTDAEKLKKLQEAVQKVLPWLKEYRVYTSRELLMEALAESKEVGA